jgi:hypothetical protein
VVTVGAATTERAGLRGRVVRWRASPNAWPVAFLVVLPILVFAVPAMIGRPAISYDNLLQNFPLRVLSGSLIGHGHLPLWNPTIWAGSPLLGGLNAGSFYPGTLLFAALPAVGAWVLNLIGVYWAAGLGTYALLRQYSLRPLACLLAAVTYQFGGAMTGQLVHLGVIQGMAWMPLIVLAELRLSWAVLGTGPTPEYRSRPLGSSSPWPWVTLLAALIGLIFLTGEPRSMAETELVASFVLGWLVLRSYPGERVDPTRRVRCLAYGVLAAGWGAVIGLSQLLPGRAFIVASQRATESYSFFASGSLKPSWSILLLVQNLFGGNQILGQPPYSNTYNLPEVTGYVGLLPLVALVVLALRSFGRRSDPRARDWRPWVVLVGFGMLLSWGEYTPLGHVFAQIPFYNRVRLDSRSLGIVDLGLAVLFGFWLELFMAGEWRERMAGRGQRARELIAPMLAPAAGLLAALVALAIPATVLVYFGANPVNASGERPWMAAQAAIGAGALLVVWAWRRWTPAAARRLLTGFIALDLGLFALTCSTGMFSGGQPEPSRGESAAIVGTTGRFAIVDDPFINAVSPASVPDIDGLTDLDSVQGYGSILGGTYENATGTHSVGTMDPCALAEGVFVALRLSTLLILPQGLVREIYPGQQPTQPQTCRAPGPGTATSRTWYLGQELELKAVAVHGPKSSGPAPKVGVVRSSGAISFPAERATASRTGWTITFARAEDAIGVVARGDARVLTDASTVTAAGGALYELDGLYQDALGQTSWHPAGFWDGYARFRTAKIAPPVAVRGAPGATVRQVSVTAWGNETDVLDTPTTATVVRSEAYLSGWSVRAQPAGGGPARTLPVFAVGLVQGVRVPPGRWTLTFSYWPSGLTRGGIASGLGVAAVLGVTGVRLWRRRRRRERPMADAGQ